MTRHASGHRRHKRKPKTGSQALRDNLTRQRQRDIPGIQEGLDRLRRAVQGYEDDQPDPDEEE
jgi:hypothetical protein